MLDSVLSLVWAFFPGCTKLQICVHSCSFALIWVWINLQAMCPHASPGLMPRPWARFQLPSSPMSTSFPFVLPLFIDRVVKIHILGLGILFFSFSQNYYQNVSITSRHVLVVINVPHSTLAYSFDASQRSNSRVVSLHVGGNVREVSYAAHFIFQVTAHTATVLHQIQLGAHVLSVQANWMHEGKSRLHAVRQQGQCNSCN